MVGIETGDDAGVVRLNPSQAVVTTADFITPPFDDPFGFGRIAAANALSDVYAMGGTPLCAINLCMFPRDFDAAVAREILDGAEAALRDCQARLVGGHTVRGPELFFGLSVTGIVHPDRLWRNVGARPGDRLLLTKPLGAGLIVSGARRGMVGTLLLPDDVRRCADSMAHPNRRAAETLAPFAVHAATDITGFGLVGHALGMTRPDPRAHTESGPIAMGPGLRLHVRALPIYAGAHALAAAGVTCGGAQNNRAAYAQQIDGLQALDMADSELLFDPQTSGGLLVALAPQDADTALHALHDVGIAAAIIGEVVTRGADDLPLQVL